MEGYEDFADTSVRYSESPACLSIDAREKNILAKVWYHQGDGKEGISLPLGLARKFFFDCIILSGSNAWTAYSPRLPAGTKLAHKEHIIKCRSE